MRWIDISVWVQLLNIDSTSISKPLPSTENTTSTNLEFWHTDADRQSLKVLLQNEGVSSEDRLLAIKFRHNMDYETVGM